MFLVANATKLPIRSRVATLVYADPPYNMNYNDNAHVDDLPDHLYEQFIIDFMQEATRIMLWPAWFVVAICPNVRHIYERLCRRFLTYDQEIIWHFDFGMYTRTHFVYSHNNLLVYRLGKPEFYWEQVAIPSYRLEHCDSRADMRGRTPGTVWSIPRVPGNDLSRQFIRDKRRSCQPLDLLKRIVLAYTKPGDLVVDMFSGSGTMSCICNAFQRKCLATDICEVYINEAKQRLEYNKISIKETRVCKK